jgi:hypothetical protein
MAPCLPASAFVCLHIHPANRRKPPDMLLFDPCSLRCIANLSHVCNRRASFSNTLIYMEEAIHLPIARLGEANRLSAISDACTGMRVVQAEFGVRASR